MAGGHKRLIAIGFDQCPAFFAAFSHLATGGACVLQGTAKTAFAPRLPAAKLFLIALDESLPKLSHHHQRPH